MKIKKMKISEYFGLYFHGDKDCEITHENNGDSIRISGELYCKKLDCSISNNNGNLHVIVNIEGKEVSNHIYVPDSDSCVSDLILKDTLDTGFILNMPGVSKSIYGEFFCK